LGVILPLLLIGPDVHSSDIKIQKNNEEKRKSNTKSLTTIVIDPGHGGKIPGAKGRIAAEKDIVLQVSKKLQIAIEKELPGVKAILTRSTDVDVPFHERTNIANKNHADLFISIHCNSADVDIRV